MGCMYGFDWASRSLWEREALVEPVRSALPRERVAETLLVHWQEHCVECAPPQCYEVCPLYVARADRKCARFVYGIYPDPRFSGLLGRGADVRFRRWAKLETELFGKRLSVRTHRRLDRLDTVATLAVGGAAGALARVNPRRRLSGALTLAREAAFRRLPASGEGAYDDFVLECHAPDEEPFRLILEYVSRGETALRHAFEIRPGANFHTLPAAAFGGIEAEQDGRILLYPENDAERRLIFTWLDLVRYAGGGRAAGHLGGVSEVPRRSVRGTSEECQRSEAPAEKLKCVAWDLDNTLWTGTLLEDGPDGLRLRSEAERLVRGLDERGILQTVVSKNSHDEAWAKVVELGLDEYFLYPAINWGSKSENLRQIAERLNIGIDTFALIDDSAFERAEVSAALPMVRVYSHERLETLLERPELDVPVTEASRLRRSSYRTEGERVRARESFSGDYLDFLRSTGLQMRVFVPRSEAEVERCVELVQRSNQLNLSTRRYTRAELEDLRASPDILTVAVECWDRFGRYGIVGFAAVDEHQEVPLVLDYVLSCRVAQKRVEHTFFRWLARHEAARGASRLRAELVETGRNGALVAVLDELPFRTVERDGARRLLEQELSELGAEDDVVTLDVELDGGA